MQDISNKNAFFGINNSLPYLCLYQKESLPNHEIISTTKERNQGLHLMWPHQHLKKLPKMLFSTAHTVTEVEGNNNGLLEQHIKT